MMESPIVTVLEGKLKGCQSKNLDGEVFYSFLGIPYGQPPIGELRFKPPEPAKSWIGMKNATENGNPCIQRNDFTDVIEGSEDCLYLNVYTKALPEEKSTLKPVMVWIHGGAFIKGSNDPKRYGPEHLMLEDIVLVCVNFRLGFFGHLFLNDSSLNINGNTGLKDQQLALKWVQKNIKNFNGDHDNVTIFGQSSGSASVHYQVVSPAKGLFHKAILQSGCLFCPWARVDEEKYENFGVQLAQITNPNVKNEKEALETLRNLSAEDLLVSQEKFILKYGRHGKICPNIEKPNPTEIISNLPDELIASGRYNKVPLLMGFTNTEGLLFEVYYQNAIRSGIPPIEYYALENCIHPHLHLTENDEKKQIIMDKLNKTYFNEDNGNNKYLLATDYFYIAPTLGAAKLHAKTSSEPVYLFNITIDAGLNFLKRMSNLTHLSGTCHGDELGYLFNRAIGNERMQKGSVEILAVRRLVKLWTNFAKFGNPTPEGNDLNVTWKPIDDKDVYYLDIGEELILQRNPVPERMKVWEEIFDLSPNTKYYK